MARGLSFKDAAALLGEEPTIVKTLNTLTGGMLLLATAGGSTPALALFDAKGDFISLSGQLLGRLTEKLNGLDRLSRAQRLEGAHSVIVVTSFFDVLKLMDDRKFFVDESVDPDSHPDWSLVAPEVRQVIARGIRRRLRQALQAEERKQAATTWNPKSRDRAKSPAVRLTPEASNQVLSMVGTSPNDQRLATITTTLLVGDLPRPAPQRPFEATRGELEALYRSTAALFAEATLGQEWELLDPQEQASFSKNLQEWVATSALARYSEDFGRLAGQFPEFAYWANAIDHQATRLAIEAMGTGLRGLEDGLRQLAGNTSAPANLTALDRAYQSALQRPIVETGDIPNDGMVIPSLGDAYINPRFQACDADASAPIQQEGFWDTRGRDRDDIQSFLIGVLSGREATESPILILGQPGSGKSVLTKVLAARLPAHQFLAVRVVLRDVSAEADIQTQVEQAMFNATGERLQWAEVSRTSGSRLPVIFFDGFDELLQVTGVSQSDYLERIVRFQEREAAQGRPCAALITSRVAVADRARIPVGGLVVVRLQPFSDSQIAKWVDLWNSTNSTYFDSSGNLALSADALLRQGDISRQPLLLLMLALYDADGNPLQSEALSLVKSEVYERLLRRFANREILKTSTGCSSDTIDHMVNRELEQLSIAALAMFSRSRPWVTMAELDADLSSLRPLERASQDSPRTTPASFRAPLSASESLIGRFFFIHETRAVVNGKQAGTIEFLHATFGEYLVARISCSELSQLVTTEQFAKALTRRENVSDEFLAAYLSFASVSTRATTVAFLVELLDQLPRDQRTDLRRLLLRFFGGAISSSSRRSHETYQPTQSSMPQQCATYTSNLLVLILLVGPGVSAAELFPDSEDPAEDWHRYAMLCRSQLTADAWRWLSATIIACRTLNVNGTRDVFLYWEDLPASVPGAIPRTQDLYWSTGRSFDPESTGWVEAHTSTVEDSNALAADSDLQMLLQAVRPLFDSALSPSMTTAVGASSTKAFSAAEALVRLWVSSGLRAPIGELTDAYDDCFEAARVMMDNCGPSATEQYRRAILSQLAQDLRRLPGPWRDKARVRLEKTAATSPESTTWVSQVVTSLGLRGRQSS